MKINGKTFSQHLRLVAPYLGLLSVIWLLRLVAYAAGLPMGWVTAISLSVAMVVCTVLAVVQVHLGEWGSYGNVVLMAFLFNVWTQVQISLTILFSLVTGIDTVYNHPSFTIPPGGVEPWTHIYGQMTFVLGFGTLFASASGCLLLVLLRLLLPNTSRES